VRRVTASAPGVVKLFGEHAVVYGKPAIAMAINKRLYVAAVPRMDGHVKIVARDLRTRGLMINMGENGEIGIETEYGIALNAVSYLRTAIDTARMFLGEKRGIELDVSSEMPVGAGLGTSAAVAVASIRAYAEAFGYSINNEEVARLAHEVEKTVQGAASPMDTTVSALGGIHLISTNGRETIKAGPLPIVIGYVERESTTRDLVKSVGSLRSKYPSIIDLIMDAIGEVTKMARHGLEANDLGIVADLMNINQGLLESLGVSTGRLSSLIYAARRAGAIGAKLSGAGGGGIVIALAPNAIKEVAIAMEVAGGHSMIVDKDEHGAKID